MSGLWQGAIIVMAIVILALAVLVLGLLRRAVDALDRVEEALSSHSVQPDHLRLGHDRLQAVGESHTLPGISGLPTDAPYLVTFLEEGCEGCRLLAVDVTKNHRRAARSGLTLAFVLDAPSGPLSRLPALYPCVIDGDGTTSDAWHVTSSPVAFLVSPSGLVLAGDVPNSFRQLLALRDQYERVALTDGVEGASIHG